MEGSSAELVDLDECVRQQARRLLADDLSLAEFEEWFAGATWDEDSSDLVANVNHLLSEGRSDVELLRAELQRLVSTICLEMRFGVNQTISRRMELAGR